MLYQLSYIGIFFRFKKKILPKIISGMIKNQKKDEKNTISLTGQLFDFNTLLLFHLSIRIFSRPPPT